MGMRGIPKGYSGFETFVRELAPRLVSRGHEVTVYGRSYHQEKGEYKGVKLVSLPTIRRKHMETILHTTLCGLHSLFCGYDIVYICIVGNSPAALLPRLGGAMVVLNVDGADCEREKWGRWAQGYLRWTERIATRTAHKLIADAEIIQDRYRKLYNAGLEFIPYGGNIVENAGDEALEQFGLVKNDYFLFVGRLVPENSAHLLIEAFKQLRTDRTLVIVGDAPYADEYKAQLHAMAAPNVIFTGYIFDKGYQQISSNAYCYVLPSGVDGTRPVLLDQLGFGNCVVARGTSANREVVGDCGLLFDPSNPLRSLVEILQNLIDNPNTVKHYKKLAPSRIKAKYSWDQVTSRYEELFERLLRNGRRRRQ